MTSNRPSATTKATIVMSSVMCGKCGSRTGRSGAGRLPQRRAARARRLQPGAGALARRPVRGEDVVEAGDGGALHAVEHRLDQLRDLAESQRSGEKLLDRYLVGGVEHGRRSAARRQRSVGKLEAGEAFQVGTLEPQRADARQVEKFHAGLDALGVAERVGDGSAHIRV